MHSANQCEQSLAHKNGCLGLAPHVCVVGWIISGRKRLGAQALESSISHCRADIPVLGIANQGVSMKDSPQQAMMGCSLKDSTR